MLVLITLIITSHSQLLLEHLTYSTYSGSDTRRESALQGGIAGGMFCIGVPTLPVWGGDCTPSDLPQQPVGSLSHHLQHISTISNAVH